MGFAREPHFEVQVDAQPPVAIISHDCKVGVYSHIAPGAVLVGMGVTTSAGLRIGDGSIIDNGSVVCQDVPAGTIESAGSIWPR